MKLLNRIISYSFYSLFFLVPLIFSGSTSELFEFNKMWICFGLTIIITTAWLSKMVLQKKFVVQRTPLDIFIGLFFVSQLISTLFSLDPHVSWWGYYSRFNGGMLSTICYVLLYYAFVSNLNIKHVLRTISVSLIAGLLVALWGFPSHFGADPTCLVFRGSFDTSCWTDAFKPTIRAFSTLGQPAWFAAYLSILLPLAMVSALNNKKSPIKLWGFIAIASLFYACLIFANTRAGFLAFIGADIILWGLLFITKVFPRKFYLRYLVIIHAVFLAGNVMFGFPIGGLGGLSLSDLNQRFASIVPQAIATAEAPQASAPAAAPNIPDSGNIRLLVWRGAIDAWKANPIFGTGVETFAFAYYKYKPQEHNLTSEWDYLYNKAHNEYLNYLTTTGLFGLGTYLAFIGFFLFLFGKYLIAQMKTKEHEHTAMNIALVSAFISILISNFFGFSVVIINLYLFLIPAFFLILSNSLKPAHVFQFPSGATAASGHSHINPYQWTAIGFFVATSGYLILGLFSYWSADMAYALGNNLDKTGAYQEAYPQLMQAVKTKDSEPVYKDELSINLGTLATALYLQKDAKNGEQFAKEAIALSDQVVQMHPNNIVFWKNRVRLFYTLAQGDPEHTGQYLQEALVAIQKAYELAPTDAKIAYNLGVLLGQNGHYEEGIEILEKTIKLKPDYKDAYSALGLSYHALAVDKDNKVINPEAQKKAIEIYQYILKNLAPEDKQVKDNLRLWEQGK